MPNFIQGVLAKPVAAALEGAAVTPVAFLQPILRDVLEPFFVYSSCF